jgi:RHS repeat-associated protein
VPKAREIQLIHNDHLGTPWFITNKNQLVVWAGDYLPFGELYAELANTQNPHRFPGQCDGPTTSLHYNWHRYYSTELGRDYEGDSSELEARPVFGSGCAPLHRNPPTEWVKA